MVGLVEAELGTDVERVIEMACQALELGLDVIAQSRRDFDLLAVGFDAHRQSPSRTGGRWRATCRGRQHRATGVRNG
jgi:hypothetical protein